MQFSVTLYHASGIDRGTSLDTIDVPLNDVRYLTLQFAQIALLHNETSRVAALLALANEHVVGPGSFYDDLGNIHAQPHLLPGQVCMNILDDLFIFWSSLSFSCVVVIGSVETVEVWASHRFR
jgi:hypothetical protein